MGESVKTQSHCCEDHEEELQIEAQEADSRKAADLPRSTEPASDQQEAPAFRVILASASPRRKQLLEEAGVRFVVHTPQAAVDETLDPDELAMPVEAAKKLAEKKAGAVVQELLAEQITGHYIVLGADTIVVLDGRIFGKPRNLEDAKRMLRELSGRIHEVITAVSLWMIAAPDEEDVSLAYRTLAEKSTVTFKTLTEEEIADYLRKGESFDKAGAYAIQGEGAQLVEGFEGALDNIIGLPVERLLKEFPDLKG